MRFHARAYDRHGWELWDDYVEADDQAAALEEAKAEYAAYTTGAYELGHYKAQAMLDAVDRYYVEPAHNDSKGSP